MLTNDLYFLLKEKYKINEIEINSIIDKLSTNDSSLSPEILTDYKLLLSGYPLDYIIGYVDFINCHIDLAYKPLIPRPETEYWVYEFIKLHKNHGDLKILDLFAGSGCIGISILKNIEGSEVVFAEIDINFLKQIEKNCELNQINKSRYKIVQSDVFSGITSYKIAKFEYIMANPPYVGRNDPTGPEIQAEPVIALYSGNNGLEITETFLIEAKEFFRQGLYCEINEFRKDDLEKMVRNLGYNSYEFFKDQYGKWRVITIKI